MSHDYESYPIRQSDRRSFRLDAEKWTAFMAALEAPVGDLPRLKRLVNEPSIFPDPDPV
ncbi:DUF1778 domain-containing protein [Mesorhizobium sp. WSM3859]|uniref:type II toxin -antitoxin system TacA 1-like antitoxin n=1 Tax=Mesorhizobium sp. WSM3859 TaxID=2029402 RepID=UPI0024781BE3|nr:DUF1778 domain-containing protein [Mesorhizobium sp. WSM3859]